MKILNTAAIALAFFGFTGVVACTSGPQPSALPGTEIASTASYTLGSGDEIKVTVFGEQDVSGPFVVDGQGAISMALIGQVIVKNLSLADAEKVITTKLKDGYFRDPKVSVEMTKGRPYYISGEVTRAGEYPFTSGLTVMKAIAAAGDFTYRADRTKIMVKSADGMTEQEVVLTPTTPVHPGDAIRVRERFF
jgi:protein involved in polysaccharide export with SLBB domain